MTTMCSFDAQSSPSSSPALALVSRAGLVLSATPGWTHWLPPGSPVAPVLAREAGLAWPPPPVEGRYFGRSADSPLGLGAMPCGDDFLLWREPALESPPAGACLPGLAVAWASAAGCCANAAWRAMLAADAAALAPAELLTLLQAAAGPLYACAVVELAAGDAGAGWAAVVTPAPAAAGLLPELARGVAHEFNNLLHIIANVNDTLLALDTLDPDDRPLVEDSREAADRAVVLVEQLRVAARASGASLVPLDLVPVLLEATAAAENLGGVVVEAELPDHAWLRGDVVQLRSLLHQLCANAAQAMPHGGTLRLACQVDEHCIRVTVEDTGAGIPAGLRERIFQPSFTAGRPAGCSGLGLTVARMAAEAHGGTLVVDPTATRGARLLLSLPAAPVAGAAPRVVPPAAAVAPVAGRKLRILVAEDEPLVASFVSRAFSLHGIEHTVLADGAEALVLLSTPDHGYDLAFLDICMPGLRGDEVVVALRQAGNLLPVVLTTGYAPDEFLADAREASWVLLRKPYQQDELFQAIATALAG